MEKVNSIKTVRITDSLVFLHLVFTYCFDTMGGILGSTSKLIMVMLIFVTLVPKILRLKISGRINGAFLLSVVFAIYCFTLDEYQQGEWSRLLNVNFQTAISVALAVLVSFSIYYYANTPAKRENVIRWISFAGVCLSALTLLIVRERIIFGLHTNGMTSYLAQYGLQSNQMGVCFGLSFISALYLVDKYKSRKYKSYIIINFLFLFLTGSRKALIYAVVGLFVYFILSGKTNKIMRLIFSLVLVGVFYFVLMNVPVLYNMVGWRIQGLISVLSGGQSKDTTGTRFFMIQYGMQLVEEHPWFGRGLNYFSMSYGLKTGHGVYAHNNYIELLVSGGIVLTSIYYSRFLIIIKNLYSKAKFSKEAVICISFIASMLIADVAAVTYYYRIYYIIFGLTMSCAYADRRGQKCGNGY